MTEDKRSSNSESRLNRRDFVAVGLGAAAGAAALGAGAASAATQQTPKINGMPTRRLPRGGMVVPIYGLGTSAFTGIQIPGVEPLPHPERVEAIRHAYELGVRYFDTANNYRAEPAVGEALEDVREEVYINTKTGSFTREGARRQVEESLGRLRTDYADCVKVHVPNSYDIAMTVLDELEVLREEGRIRNLGMSNHIHFETAFKIIDTGRLDEVLLAKSYFPKGMSEIISQYNAVWLERAIARADELGMNIIGMKGLSAGVFGHNVIRAVQGVERERAKKLPRAAIRWIFSDLRFHAYAIGATLSQDIDDNLAIFQEDLTLTEKDLALLAEFSEKVWAAPPIRAMPEPYKWPDSPPYEEPWRSTGTVQQGS